MQHKEMIREKIEQTISILKEKNIDMWLIFLRESSTMKDPSIDIVVGTGCTWQSAYIFTKNGDTTAIVGSLDVPNTKSYCMFKEVIGYLRSIKEPLVGILDRYEPEKIAINFSRDSNLADGLTHGMYLELLEHLKDTEYTKRLVSSEEIIASLRGRKSPSEISRMKDAVAETLRIFDEVTQFIRPGQTEKEVAEFILNKVRERGLTLAWDPEHCPAVFTGPDTPGAHASPTDKVIEPGHVLNIDFGVLKNGYCSDLQRTWYFLRNGETAAPPEVQKGFDVIKQSIQLSAKELKSGMKGWEIDNIARKYITDNGYEEYPHALGHQVGKLSHDGGGLLAPKWERYGSLPYLNIEEGQVYTLEPRLTIKDFGIATIEEEVVVTKDGCEFISAPQTELILIRK